jgi:hypothetical protein
MAGYQERTLAARIFERAHAQVLSVILALETFDFRHTLDSTRSFRQRFDDRAAAFFIARRRLYLDNPAREREPFPSLLTQGGAQRPRLLSIYLTDHIQLIISFLKVRASMRVRLI